MMCFLVTFLNMFKLRDSTGNIHHSTISQPKQRQKLLSECFENLTDVPTSLDCILFVSKISVGKAEQGQALRGDVWESFH